MPGQRSRTRAGRQSSSARWARQSAPRSRVDRTVTERPRGAPPTVGAPGRQSRGVRLGLRENAAQFALLVAITAFVGAMVGLERSTLPLVGRQVFGLRSSTAVLSFIVAFGVAKSLTNLAAGALAQRVGRRRLLIAA